MIEIRPAIDADYAEWLRLWNGYLEFYGERLAPGVTETTWSRLLGGDPFFNFVASAEGGLVGLSHCLLQPSTWAKGPYCYLEDLFVSPQVRREGVGRNLLEAVIKEAGSRGCARIYWLTKKDNVTARRLYDQFAEETGFVRYVRVL